MMFGCSRDDSLLGAGTIAFVSAALDGTSPRAGAVEGAAAGAVAAMPFRAEAPTATVAAAAATDGGASDNDGAAAVLAAAAGVTGASGTLSRTAWPRAPIRCSKDAIRVA